MAQNYLEKYVPKYKEELLEYTPQKIREFVAHYKINPSALKHFKPSELIENRDLWLVGTSESKTRDNWLQEVYPSYEIPEKSTMDSILVCSSCGQRKVDYYQKQTRGADEPMTCFCNCLHCGKRWVQ